MSVLSDEEIRDRIHQGQLIVGGDIGRATECSYSFVSGAAFLAGCEDRQTIFPPEGPHHEIMVNPGKMIWIRTRERVALPKDLVGFWWQTNGLSRKGLMLVNMSMIEPGYAGDLACLFVNFGKEKVVIDARTVIAKMVFVKLIGTLLHPMTYTEPRETYDAKLRQLAVDQPTSFLQVGDMMADLEESRAKAMAEIKASTEAAKVEALAALATARGEEVTKFKDNIPGAVRSSFLWAAGALALLTVATTGAEWIKGNLFPDVPSAARAAAEGVLRDRMTISGAPVTTDTVALTRKLDALNARLDKLENHK